MRVYTNMMGEKMGSKEAEIKEILLFLIYTLFNLLPLFISSLSGRFALQLFFSSNLFLPFSPFL